MWICWVQRWGSSVTNNNSHWWDKGLFSCWRLTGEIQSVRCVSPAALSYLHAWRTLCRTVCPLWSPSLTPFTALERLGRLSQPCQSLLYQFRFYFCSDTIPSLPQIWTISSLSGAAEVVCAIYCLWSSYFLSLKWMIRLPAASAISAFFHHIVLEASMYLIWLVDRFSILRTRG